MNQSPLNNRFSLPPQLVRIGRATMLFMASVLLLSGCSGMGSVVDSFPPFMENLKNRTYADYNHLVVFDSIQVENISPDAPFTITSVSLNQRVFSIFVATHRPITFVSDHHVFARSASNGYALVHGDSCWPNVSFTRMLCNKPITTSLTQLENNERLEFVGLTMHPLPSDNTSSTFFIEIPIGWIEGTKYVQQYNLPFKNYVPQEVDPKDIQYTTIPIQVTVHQN